METKPPIVKVFVILLKDTFVRVFCILDTFVFVVDKFVLVVFICVWIFEVAPSSIDNSVAFI